MNAITLNRRGLFRASAAAAVALSIPVALPARGQAARNGDALTAYLRIAQDGSITLITPVTEMGQGTHTAHVMLIADELGVPMSAVKTVRVGQPSEPMRRPPGEQSTGGSTGTRAWVVRLRTAAAQAREVLTEAAARRMNVPVVELKAEDGAIVHAASNRSIPIGSLVREAAALPLPEKPTLRPTAELRLVGRSQPRIDIPAKVTGRAVFGMDFKVPGMLYACARLAPVYRAELDSFDKSSIDGIKGIVDVVPLPRGVAVVAENAWAAIKGAEAIAIRFKSTPHDSLDSAAFSQRMIAALDDETRAVAKNEGDVEAVLKGAARTVEAIYEVPYLAHACMETDNATAQVTNGGVTVWAPTQHQDWALAEAARAAGVDPAKVTIHTTLLGGGFGRRYAYEVVGQAVTVARAVNRPVKLFWRREDELAQGYYRPAQVARMKAGLDADGKLVGFWFRAAGPSTLAEFRPTVIRENGLDPQHVASVADSRYRFGAFRADWVRVDGPPRNWIWRSVGASQNGFFLEAFLDEVAHAAGKDPYRFRRELLAHDERALKVLDLVAERAGWGTPLPEGRARGIAYMESYGSLCAEVAEVSVGQDGVRVHRVVVALDCGDIVNPDGVEAQLMGGVAQGLSAMLGEAITLKNGAAEQRNFDTYQILRIDRAPTVETHVIRSGQGWGGVGEPGVPPLAPAVANAIFAATGRRVRRLPLTAEGLGV
ncbi:molybdopterin cofactor-binding domain-containing protein [Elioraea sp.]|uniref:xanthine dehydrogenase family protein molybdopterin-binding subunit n=1 Tax=Elioraea sp. TaxID=2185103 RepID=UPI003F6E46AB